MLHEPQPQAGASDESRRQGFEPLSANTRVLRTTFIIFLIVAACMLWGLWGLLRHYLAEPGPQNFYRSAAPVLSATMPAPLEPMPTHNALDWQDLVHLQQRENAQFDRMGWPMNPRTGEATISAAAMTATLARYRGQEAAATGASAEPLRFPPPMAPVRAGPYEGLPLANVFPPVGSAAAEEEVKESIFRPAPGPRDVKDLPTQSGPAGSHNNPAGSPAH